MDLLCSTLLERDLLAGQSPQVADSAFRQGIFQLFKGLLLPASGLQVKAPISDDVPTKLCQKDRSTASLRICLSASPASQKYCLAYRYPVRICHGPLGVDNGTNAITDTYARGRLHRLSTASYGVGLPESPIHLAYADGADWSVRPQAKIWTSSPSCFLSGSINYLLVPIQLSRACSQTPLLHLDIIDAGAYHVLALQPR